MGLNRILQIALMLTAVDQMSGVVKDATSNIDRAFKKVKEGYKDVMRGVAEVYAGKMMYDNAIKPVEDAFKRVQDAGIELKQSMLTEGGHISDKFFGLLSDRAVKLSLLTGKSQEGFLHMFQFLKSNQIDEETMAGDLGTGMAKFFKIMNTGTEEGSKFVVGLRNDFELTNSEILKMLDLVRRAHYYGGVGSSGEDAIEKERSTFSLAALGLSSQTYAKSASHMDDAEALVALSAIFHKRQLEGEATGTAFRKIFTNLLDIDKENEMAMLAAKNGIAISFHNDKGEWLGVGNMQLQFEKLKVLNRDIQAQILKPISGGKGGIATNILSVLEEFGKTGLNKELAMLSKGGSEADSFALAMSSLSSQQDVANQQWEQAKILLGQDLLPILLKVAHAMGSIYRHIATFAHNHPTLSRMMFLFVGIAAAVVTLGGAWALMSGAAGIVTGGLAAMIARGSILRVLFEVFIHLIYELGVALLTTPVGWIIMAIAAIVAAFIYWKDIVKFFSEVFSSCGHKMASVWDGITNKWNSGTAAVTGKFNQFTNYISTGVVGIGNSISSGFNRAIGFVRSSLTSIVSFVLGIGPRMYQAGANIINSIWSGIKAMINKPIDAVKHMVQKIRNLLPFSPAKEGPLRDIHRIRLIETIAESIKPNALMDKMRSVAGAVFNYAPSASISTPNAIAGGAGIVINFAPVYNSKGGGFAQDKDDFMLQSRKNAKDLLRLLEEEKMRGAMRSFM